MKNCEQWCIEQHQLTNHFYDKYLPYEFHLRMVVGVCEQFKELALEKICDNSIIEYYVLVSSCWGHDLIEDTRCSYNDVVVNIGKEVADIVYALTNEKGRNRAERGNEKYYQGIRDTKGAVFVKLCDRIANVQYSKMTRSRMFDMYKGENVKFAEMMGYYPSHPLRPMFEYLINLFE